MMNLMGDLVDVIIWFCACGIATGLAIARICGAIHPSFQAVAHVYVGMLIGVALAKKNWSYGYIAIALSIVEVAVAIITRL